MTRLMGGTQVIGDFAFEGFEAFLAFQSREFVMEPKCMLVYPIGKRYKESLTMSCTQEQLQPITTFPRFNTL